MSELAAQAAEGKGKYSQPGVVSRFIERLYELDRGDKAILRRNAGYTIAQSRNATGIFYRILPPEIVGHRDEEIYFLVATLIGYNHEPAPEGDYGATMRAVRAKTSSDSIDRRMRILLDSEFDLVDGLRPGGGEMAYRLRQSVKLAAGQRVGVDWPRLLDDLLWWSHPDKRARKRWARSYYSGRETGDEQVTEPAESVESEEGGE